MIRYRILPAIAGVFLCGWCVAPLHAQFSGPETAAGVVGTGVVTIERQPNVMRLQLMLPADGKDVKEALAALKAREAAAQAKLQKLGATEASVHFSDPQVQDASQQQQLERMIQMRTGRAPRAARSQAPAVTVSATLKAEWPLTAKDADALLIESQELQSKIKAAALAGAASDNKSPAEQEEAAEEAQVMGNGDGTGNPRDPVFTFVCKISESDRDAARAAAFKKAREDAARLARAAGSELGPIRLLVSNAAPSAPTNPYGAMYEAVMQQRAMLNMMNPQEDQEGQDQPEAVGPQPGKVGYRITVYVSFGLKG